MSQPSWNGRPAITLMGVVTFAALTLSSAPAFAGCRAWYGPWDYVGDFQSGDVSDDFTDMFPPEDACGLRIVTPSYYRWTDDVDGTIASGDLFKAVVIWIDNPGTACSRPFSTRYHDDSHTFSPPGGVGVSIEISTNYGAYWVNDDGYYVYTCNGCAGATDFIDGPIKDIWSQLAVSGFKAVSGALGDPRRQSRAAAAVAGVARQAADLQALVQSRVVARRRNLVTTSSFDVSARSLEDAAVRALGTALTEAGSCEALARQGHYLEAFKACVSAMRNVEDSDRLMRTAWSVSPLPSKPPTAARED